MGYIECNICHKQVPEQSYGMHQLRVHGNQEYIKQQTEVLRYQSVKQMEDSEKKDRLHSEDSIDREKIISPQQECNAGTLFRANTMWLSSLVAGSFPNNTKNSIISNDYKKIRGGARVYNLNRIGQLFPWTTTIVVKSKTHLNICPVFDLRCDSYIVGRITSQLLYIRVCRNVDQPEYSNMSTSIVQWTPNEQGLKQILQLLADSKTGNTEIQRRCTEQFEQFNKNVVDFNNYLAFIFIQMKQQDPSIRQAAGLILKTNLRKYADAIVPQAMEHIKALIIEGLRDPIPYIRSTAGNVMTALIYHQGLSKWPQVLPALVQLLDSNDLNAVDGAFSALLKICEDNAEQLDSEELDRPLNFLIPKFITYFAHPNENIKKTAVACVIQFLPMMPNALLANMNQFMKGISALAIDQSPRVRKYVCRAFVALLEHPQYLKPIFNDVVEYIIHCTGDTTDETLALEACEFWTAIAENESCVEFMKPLQNFLPKLVPVLVKGMVYNEMNRQILDEESNLPDKDSDIKPFFAAHKMRDFHNPNATPTLLADQVSDNYMLANTAEEDDDDDDDFEAEFDGHSDWNLRKCAASSLDIFSNIFGNDLLATLLPEIQVRLQPSRPWYERECAILALGAVAEGCRTGMYKHLPQLIPYLIGILNDPKPLVRSITCWSLSRYARWIIEQPEELYFRPLLAALLQKIVDPNKRVQEAACSAFATLEEVAHMALLPYLPHILTALQRAFEIYQKKNLFILYDAIRTLAGAVGQELNKPEYIKMLMPPLIDKWNKLADTDRNIFPLLECLTGVAIALKMGFAHFAKPVFQRCLRLIENTYVMQELAQLKHTELPDKDFIVCSLDLLSGIIEALGPNVESLIAQSKMLILLKKCMLDREYDVRQSAFGVVGDVAKTCIAQLRGVLNDYMPILVKNLSSNSVSVANNASWAIGEIAIQIGVDMKPWINDVLQKLIPIMNKTENHVSLLENTAITIGRLGLVCPDVIAPHLPTFSRNWCLALRGIRNETEKEHAYKGLCTLIRYNPQGVYNTFPFVCDAIAAYDDAKPELKQEFSKILHGFKASMGQQPWQEYFSRFPDKLQSILRKDYQL